MSLPPKRKRGMQSKNLQYIMPDDSAKGEKNKGVIGQYPYFAPDTSGLKKAPKMTKADELYLKKFMEARQFAQQTKVNDSDQDKNGRDGAHEPFEEDGKVNITINTRLFEERKKLLDLGVRRFESPDKTTLTKQVFNEHKYFQQNEDTSKNEGMQNYVEQHWEPAVFATPNPAQLAQSRQKKQALTAQAGNVVPFFPTDWKKNANDVFNAILNGTQQEEATEDVYDDATHAAIHRKVVPVGGGAAAGAGAGSSSDALADLFDKQKAVTGDRPTSGKHYARNHAFAKRKGTLEQPNHDPMHSFVAKNFEKQKKVESLLNKLAGYMAGEIPDTTDLNDLFQGNPPLGDLDKDIKTGLNSQPDEGPFDDATTAYTHGDALKPIAGPSGPSGPRIIVADPDADGVEIEEDAPPKKVISDGDSQGGSGNDNDYSDGDGNGDGDGDLEDVKLPDIADIPGNRHLSRRQRSPHRFPKAPPDNEHLFIYKDFDTSLTKVNTAHRKFPSLTQTTKVRGEDLIRDRLLSFKVRNGSIGTFDGATQKREITINERSDVRKQRQIQESLAVLKKNQRLTNSLVQNRQKAFWVHNKTQSEINLPQILNHGGSQQDIRERTTMHSAALNSARGSQEFELGRRDNSLDPIPISSKKEQLTDPQANGDVKLVQQYIMVRGKLQPALKYIAPNPMYNRYQVNQATKSDYGEIVTMPTISGDLQMKNRHVGVNYDDRDIPRKTLPAEKVQTRNSRAGLEDVAKSLQKKNISYNRNYYHTVQRRDKRAIDPDEIDDPRTLGEIEQENMDLKEQLLHQMVTAEQYMNVAYMWHANLQEGYNPFDEEFQRLQEEINFDQDDFATDNINTVPPNEDDRHEIKYEPMQAGTDQSLNQNDYQSNLRASQKKKKAVFKIPSQVHSMASKVKNLFYRESSQDWLSPELLKQQKAQQVAAQQKAAAAQAEADFQHYADNDYERQLHAEVDGLRDKLEADFRNQRIIDFENKIRDNKRIIVNLMTENIFNLRFGHAENKETQKKLDREELLATMYGSRLKRIRVVEKLLKVASQQKYELMTWGVHSDLLDLRKMGRAMTDVVVLLQEKNLLAEMLGQKNYVQVGEIERQLDWPIRIRNQLDPLDADDYYSRKLRQEIDQQNAIIVAVEKDMGTVMTMNKEMKAFISAIFGNDGWIKLVEARYLRKKQERHAHEYDPQGKDAVPVYVRQGYNPDAPVPRQIIDELPTHGMDQFGAILARSDIGLPQAPSKDIYSKLFRRRQGKQVTVKSLVPKKDMISTLARQAVRGRDAIGKALVSKEASVGNPQGDDYEAQSRSDHLLLQSRTSGLKPKNDDSQFNAGAFLDESMEAGSIRGGHETAKLGSIRGSQIGDGPESMFGSMNDIDDARGRIHTQQDLRGLNQDALSKGDADGDSDSEEDSSQLNDVGAHLMAQVKAEQEQKKQKEKDLAVKDIKEEVLRTTLRDQARKTQGPSADAAAGDNNGEEIKAGDTATKPKAGGWLARIRAEQLEREEKAAKAKLDRQKKLKAILDSESEDGEDGADIKKLAKGGDIKDFLSKIEAHVQAEQKILDAWVEKDNVDSKKKKK